LPEWKIEPEWAGDTAVVLASGPSMTREQCEKVRHLRTIAVNNQGIDTIADKVMVPALAPWADILYAADSKWWDHYGDRALKFAGRKVTIRGSQYKGLLWLRQSAERTFDVRPNYLATGGNSAYQALHIAVHLGARRVILLGVDMKVAGRRKHWFGDHPHKLNTMPNFGNWMKAFRRLAPIMEKRGVEVINCSPDSALDAFPRQSLEAALKC
jgi:hypothetical protein